jgi:hypothetical protein
MSSSKSNAKYNSQLKSNPTYILSALLAAAMVIQSVGGIFIKGLYRDNKWVASIFLGTDIVTLVVIVPVIIISLMYTIRGSLRARLILLGTLYYSFYNNIYYLFSTFNRFFLVYVAIFILSLSALIVALHRTEADKIKGLERSAPRKAVSVAMFICAGILSLMWIGQSILFIITGQIPQIIIDSGGITHMVAALDLSLEVPPLVIGGILLWKARPWGVAISTIILVQCILIVLVLIVTPPFQEAAGVKDAYMIVPLWAVMGVIFLIPAIYILKKIKTE